MKTCTKCGKEKPVTEFTKGYWQCKTCHNTYARSLRQKKSVIERKDMDLKLNYKISLPDFIKMWEDQNRECLVCLKEFDPFKMVVDHDHSCCPKKGRSCGRCIRGLLCSDCNTLVGKVEISRKRIEGVLKYLGWSIS